MHWRRGAEESSPRPPPLSQLSSRSVMDSPSRTCHIQPRSRRARKRTELQRGLQVPNSPCNGNRARRFVPQCSISDIEKGRILQYRTIQRLVSHCCTECSGLTTDELMTEVSVHATMSHGTVGTCKKRNSGIRIFEIPADRAAGGGRSGRHGNGRRDAERHGSNVHSSTYNTPCLHRKV
jgi:hypothetical protein